MEDLTQRTQQVIESLTGNEALTDNLDDTAAQVLLDWGIAYGKQVVQSTADLTEEAAAEAMAVPLQAIRRLLRAVNQSFAPAVDAETNQAQPDARAKTLPLLQKVVEQRALIGGAQFRQPDEQQLAAFAVQLAQTASTPATFIATLRQFVDQQQGAAPTPAAPAPVSISSPPALLPASTERTAWFRRFFARLRRFYPQAKQID